MKNLDVALGKFFELVREERERQDTQHGADRSFCDEKWLRIMVEEVGECARAIEDHDTEGLELEIVQVAAVCAQWLQSRWLMGSGLVPVTDMALAVRERLGSIEARDRLLGRQS